MPPKSAAERKAAERARRKRLGLKRREFYLTDEEYWYLQGCLKRRRKITD